MALDMLLEAGAIVASWILTYALHSAVVCVSAVCAARAIRSPRDRDVLWKAAIVMPLLTSTITQFRGQLQINAYRLDATHLFRSWLPSSVAGQDVDIRRQLLGAIGEQSVVRVTDPLATAVTLAILGIALLCGTFAVFRLRARNMRLRAELAGRARVNPSQIGLEQDYGTLKNGAHIRLSFANHLDSPVALDGNEVVIGPSFLSLSIAQRRSVMAHELAHLERGDPVWIMLAELLGAVTAFQPLTTVVVRSMRRDAEFACDDAAARRTGDAITLVETLSLIARSYDRTAGAVGYAGSPIIQRAERLLSRSERTISIGAPRLILFAAILTLAIPLLVPPVSTTAPLKRSGFAGMRNVVDTITTIR